MSDGVLPCLTMLAQILGRAGDAEESMQKLAADVCREMWFGTGTTGGNITRVSHHLMRVQSDCADN